MTKTSVLRSLMLLGALMICVIDATAAQAPDITALTALEKGEWELRERGASTPVVRLCIGDPGLLLQVRHARNSCTRFVVKNSPERVTVTYNCPGAGKGRTDMRVETSRLVQIHSQGVADGAPFAFAMEGRRTGTCR